MERRVFLGVTAGAVLHAAFGKMSVLAATETTEAAVELPFKISLAEWSLHKRLFGTEEPVMVNLDFPGKAREYGIDAIEYVNGFFMDKARDEKYLVELKKRADDNDVRSLLIMCDGEGSLGNPDEGKRKLAVENHYKWVEAAKFLGCHSIRVNAHSEGSADEQKKLAVDGLSRLSEYAEKYKLNVIVENHWGLSSQPEWLTGVIKEVGKGNCGTLPDFGNFPEEVDKYEAVAAMMPFAKGVSAKSYAFDENGQETKIDYPRMMDIVLKSGYKGYVGIEFEGSEISEEEGILATKRLLEKIRTERQARLDLSSAYRDGLKSSK